MRSCRIREVRWVRHGMYSADGERGFLVSLSRTIPTRELAVSKDFVAGSLNLTSLCPYLRQCL